MAVGPAQLGRVLDGFGLPSNSWSKGLFAAQRYRITASTEVLGRAKLLFIGIYNRQDGSRGKVLNPQAGKPLDGVIIPLDLRSGALPSDNF